MIDTVTNELALVMLTRDYDDYNVGIYEVWLIDRLTDLRYEKAIGAFQIC